MNILAKLPRWIFLAKDQEGNVVQDFSSQENLDDLQQECTENMLRLLVASRMPLPTQEWLQGMMASIIASDPRAEEALLTWLRELLLQSNDLRRMLYADQQREIKME